MPLASGTRLAVYEIQAPLPPSTILHVVTLYSVEECDGAHFLTMELIEGQPLDRMISENGLPVEPSPSTSWMDPLPPMGFQIAYAGDWERGCALAERATRLNPHHPGWYWFPSFFDAYRKNDYRGALDAALKVNMPGFWRTHLALATAYGQLGEREAARRAVRDLIAIRPDFAAVAREELGKWWAPELVEHLIDGLRNTGLEIAPRLL